MSNELHDAPAEDAVVSETPEATEPPVAPDVYVRNLVTAARQAAGRVAALTTAVKNEALTAMADAVEAREADILAKNELDLEAFDATPERKAAADRLRLTPERIRAMADGIRKSRACRTPGRHAQDVDQTEWDAGRASSGPDRCHRHCL
ncbi:MAG: hypothetical protein U0231_13270 [Nitrospiraceae bacterium]